MDHTEVILNQSKDHVVKDIHYTIIEITLRISAIILNLNVHSKPSVVNIGQKIVFY